LVGEEIPLGARIVAVCDAYDAMTSDRPYRHAMPPNLATEELLAESGSQFDPRCVDLLVKLIRSFGETALDGAFVRYAT
jgi:HD-GYP domain-containing protein (c-di-GMP phosphodiesterase class II)